MNKLSIVIAIVVGLLGGVAVDRAWTGRSNSPAGAGIAQEGSVNAGTNSILARMRARNTNSAAVTRGGGRVTLNQIAAEVSRAQSLSYQNRYAALLELANRIDSSDIPAALQIALKLANAEARQTLVYRLTARWAELDPQTAMDFANTIGNANLRNSATESVLSSWAEKDLLGATNWLKKQPAGAQRNRFLQSIVAAMARNNPQD
ncbi:MAG TPA: hypothetical protein VK530_12545, partial [Candidatus Acidoferrum sp.]|nr:hypothetical protein [Candidatus Acidoferrum sp.]